MRLSDQLGVCLFTKCNYSELHVTCRLDCLESKTVHNYNCSMEIIGSPKYGLISELQSGLINDNGYLQLCKYGTDGHWALALNLVMH